MEYALLIDGQLVAGTQTLEVVNPATGKPLALAPRADEAQAETAIAAARRAFPAWAALGYAKRRAYLETLATAMEQRAEDFARLLTQEQGKPIEQARGEVGASVAAIAYYAEQELTPRTLRESEGERIIEQRYPLGVVAAITPWNYPLLLLVLKMAPALITGNTVIGKPAPTTPLTTLLLGEIAASILPAGVFQTLVDQNDVGALLSGHPDVAHVSFTGSTPTGKKVLASAADTLKRFTLELGGNDAALVLDDADIAQVAPRIFAGATTNSGQICLAIKRVYAPRDKLDALCDALAKLAGEAVVGDGLEQGTTIGPIQNRAQYEKVLGFIEEARGQGTLVAGGEPVAGEGYFIAPTIVRDLPDDARLVREEQFGPVLPVLAYDDLDEVIARVNGTDYGLGATVWTSDAERGIAVASRIESGTVWVNRHLDLPFDVPFGGAKQSGIGRQQGIEGMEDFTQPRIVNAALS
ncbi:acyl-CoA reductase-like NAD-dependent aldehyde dehydrogenase [Novosphingobium sp. PhB165]|uniref:aldehyde dehydrogenase family protein n=1 Tax=Novosphingobium sp. PhB165 TaxID=2485105 RepID=UPI0010456B89|nr:aldehyde dehydrogenase family protein [Novosphingobium sp. PhB165]TCM20801.1 acyl-CoA reductase-like NAD-dependent aldehyde dehydrogenase [Novosphingobium sp. PhB165]